ncbi:hypothetical protein ACFSO0_02615 [Brevibacillus sp. GCM10020057]|uniref:hypothetical protein n=1 Tax=Brevibacillus sp. GCM10020057 TaxID=3317327 RepID=UPI003637A407
MPNNQESFEKHPETSNIFEEFQDYMKERLINDEHILGRLLMAYSTPYDFFSEFVNKLSSRSKSKTPVKRRTKGTVTISSIANNIEKDFLEGRNESYQFAKGTSAKTFVRRFEDLLSILGIDPEQVKDENGHFAVDSIYEPYLAAFLLELNKVDGFASKLLRNKIDEIAIIDIIDFFDSIATYTEIKVKEQDLDEDFRQQFLFVLDEVIMYQFFVHIHNIQHGLELAINELAKLPYVQRVIIAEDFDQNVVRKWLNHIVEVRDRIK